MAKKGHNSGGVAGDQLRSYIERIERLEEEKAGIGVDIREVFAEAKANGFDPKTMRQIIKLRKLDENERDEQEALLDIYKAALGMLNDTPLGEAAVRRLSPPPEEGEEESNNIKTPAPSDKEMDAARKKGQKAASDGKPITSNPYMARDPRRAAWDEEWCKTAGSDGMDLPEAWRRSKKKNPDEKKGE